MKTFKRIEKPGEPRGRKRRRVVPCRHIRPRRCCMACRQYYCDHYGEEKGLRRFNEVIESYRRRDPMRSAATAFDFGWGLCE